MKNLLITLSLFIFIALLFSGCATVSLPTICDTAPAESVICPKLVGLGIQFEDVDFLMQAAVLRLVENKNKVEILSYLSEIQSMLTVSTYETILNRWRGLTVELTGPEVMLLNRYLSVMSVDKYLCKFDKKLVLGLIKHQITLLE